MGKSGYCGSYRRWKAFGTSIANGNIIDMIASQPGSHSRVDGPFSSPFSPLTDPKGEPVEQGLRTGYGSLFFCVNYLQYTLLISVFGASVCCLGNSLESCSNKLAMTSLSSVLPATKPQGRIGGHLSNSRRQAEIELPARWKVRVLLRNLCLTWNVLKKAKVKKCTHTTERRVLEPSDLR